jgi:hypothetical protein
MAVAEASAEEQRKVWPSPDGQIIIKQPQFRGPILFVDSTTEEVLRSEESGAKTLSVVWSADSKWVSIFQYFNPHKGGSAFEVYSISGRRVRTITMPKHWPEPDDYEWFFEPKQWLGRGRLLVEGEHSRVRPADSYDLFSYVLQCQRDGSSHVVKKRFVKTETEQ